MSEMNSSAWTIRVATKEDLPAILAIYNDEVLNGVATFDTAPREGAEADAWFTAHNIKNHPLLVSEQNGRIGGYVSLSTFNVKAAYDSTVELSLYIDREFRGQSLGKQMMKAVLDYAEADAVTHNVISLITGTNEASLHLHERFGFTKVGTMHEVGFKAGQLLDVHIYERILK